MRIFGFASYPDITKEDMIKGLESEEALRNIDAYIQRIFINRARLEKVNESDFEEFLSAYRKKHAELLKDDDFYVPGNLDIQEMIAIAWRELVRGGKDISGIQYAINLALKYFPNNREALRLKEKIERQGR